MQDIERFLLGFRQFQQRLFGVEHDRFADIKQGQHPQTLVIACSDSRVDPAILTESHLGDMFVVRNVANLVPPCEQSEANQGVSAAIQFGVCQLQVKQIIVLGHAHCGGINALMHGRGDKVATDDYLGKWVRIAEPARVQVKQALSHKSLEEQCKACEMAAILVSLDNLMSFPFIAERVAAKTLTLYGWYFDIEAGSLTGYDPQSGSFRSLVASLDKKAVTGHDLTW